MSRYNIGLWHRWAFPKDGPCKGLELVGFSRSSDKTGFWVPQLRLYLDAGVMENGVGKFERVFITHTHADHAFHAPYLFSRELCMQFHVPAEAVAMFDDWLRAGQRLNNNSADEGWWPKWQTNGNRPGDLIDFTVSNRKLHVEVIACDHSVPCVGYGFTEMRSKLKAEYAALPGKEIAALRKQGVEVQEEAPVPLFAFMGDTTVAIYERDPALAGRYPVLITECTILRADEMSPDDARERKHTHWLSLEPVVRANPATLFVLIHFSTRYTDAEIHAFFQGIPNVLAFVPPPAAPAAADPAGSP